MTIDSFDGDKQTLNELNLVLDESFLPKREFSVSSSEALNHHERLTRERAMRWSFRGNAELDPTV